ncbi:MAG: hypothetical protein AAFQ65_03840 [Myxococcota bacterium]
MVRTLTSFFTVVVLARPERSFDNSMQRPWTIRDDYEEATVEHAMMIRLSEIDASPVSEIFYQFAGSGGRTETGRLEIEVGRVDWLPREIDGLVVASDLQGIAPSWFDAGANTPCSS